MSLSLARIRHLVAQCDPQRPLEGGSPLYVPLDEARGDQSCIELLRRTILTSEDRSCQLFTGFPGTGKTTELRRLERKIAEAPSPDGGYVLFIDFEEYIDRYQPLAIADVLRVLAFCVSAEADRVEGTDRPPGEAYLAGLFGRVKQWLPRDAALKSLGFDVYGVKFMAELRNNPSVYEQVAAAIRLRFQSFADECLEMIKAGLARIRRRLGSRADRFLIIADGLEKVGPLDGSRDDRVEDSIESLFTAHSEFLKLPCHLIYTFPVWLRFRTSQLGALFESEPLTLPMVKVRERAGGGDGERRVHAEGVRLLYQLLARRLERPEEVFGADPEAALRPIITASGGYPRDALRLVRNLLRHEASFPLPAEAVERAIQSLRSQYHDKVLGTDADLLRHVAATHRRPSESPDQLRRFGKLFTDFLVFAYRNGEEWFDIHPLVEGAPALGARPPVKDDAAS